MTAPQLPITRLVPVIAHAVVVFGDEHKGLSLAVHTPPLAGQSPALRTP
jgi:hypothetical protein